MGARWVWTRGAWEGVRRGPRGGCRGVAREGAGPEGSRRSGRGLTEQQDDAGQHDDQGAQADAHAPGPPGSGSRQAGAVRAAAAHSHVQGLLAPLGRLPGVSEQQAEAVQTLPDLVPKPQARVADCRGRPRSVGAPPPKAPDPAPPGPAPPLAAGRSGPVGGEPAIWGLSVPILPPGVMAPAPREGAAEPGRGAEHTWGSGLHPRDCVRRTHR